MGPPGASELWVFPGVWRRSPQDPYSSTHPRGLSSLKNEAEGGVWGWGSPDGGGLWQGCTECLAE